LRVGDSRFFPTLTDLAPPREECGDGTKPELQRLWKRYQVVLELRVAASISRDQPDNRRCASRICQKQPGMLQSPEMPKATWNCQRAITNDGKPSPLPQFATHIDRAIMSRSIPAAHPIQ
jgi:hypothetical protein